MRWDTKPDKRIRGTFPTPDRRRSTSSYAAVRARGPKAGLVLIRLDGEIDSVLSVRVDDGLVSAIYTVRNPEKLSRMMEESTLTR